MGRGVGRGVRIGWEEGGKRGEKRVGRGVRMVTHLCPASSRLEARTGLPTQSSEPQSP